ncbi:MAG TPA: hypothetical protein VNG93_03600 [Candidatus Dormibacteraeota bacterium]|nr:hypothetical protein [Candidatus Dormibacteraeota bacterium]
MPAANLRRTTWCWSLSALPAAALLVACSTGGSPTPTPTPSAAASAIAAAPPTPSPNPTGVAKTLDPCQLVTSQEASVLSGASYGAGREDTSGGSKICVYGYQTVNVFMVLDAVAADAATAQAGWAQEQAQAQAALQQGVGQGASVSFNVTDVSTITGADRGAAGTATGTFSGHAISGSAIYLLKGATFLTFSDVQVGQTPPTVVAMEAQALTSLGRLP